MAQKSKNIRRHLIKNGFVNPMMLQTSFLEQGGPAMGIGRARCKTK
jgi:hypothetical protein